MSDESISEYFHLLCIITKPQWSGGNPVHKQWAKPKVEGGLGAWEAGSNGSGSQDPEENE